MVKLQIKFENEQDKLRIIELLSKESKIKKIYKVYKTGKYSRVCIDIE